jgi:DNA-nicking Smr family endonuclease
LEIGGDAHRLMGGADKDDGTKAWARLTADTKKLTGETRNRHVPEGDKPISKKSVSQKKTGTPAPLATKANATKANTAKANTAKANEAQATRRIPNAIKPTPQDDLQLRTRRRLSRGTIVIDGKIDLHGLSAAQAETALARFVARAQSQNQIWLLVVTGKGERGEGKLRRSLPAWLDRGALAGRVVEYGPAAPNHGGGGAFYLRLRRQKPDA